MKARLLVDVKNVALKIAEDDVQLATYTMTRAILTHLIDLQLEREGASYPPLPEAAQR